MALRAVGVASRAESLVGLLYRMASATNTRKMVPIMGRASS